MKPQEKRHQKTKKTPTTPSLVLQSAPFTTPTERENAEEKKQQQGWDFISHEFSQALILRGDSPIPRPHEHVSNGITQGREALS